MPTVGWTQNHMPAVANTVQKKISYQKSLSIHQSDKKWRYKCRDTRKRGLKRMNSLACLRPPLFPVGASSPWMETNPSLLPIPDTQHENQLCYAISSEENEKPRAALKGFGPNMATAESKKNKKIIQPKKQKDDDDDTIPQVVFDRMMARIVFYVGAPMATGVGLIYLFQLLKAQNVWDVPLWLPLFTTVLSFGTSALGIAYGTLSTSWDPNKKGSLLGWEEAQKNWPQLWREEESKRL